MDADTHGWLSPAVRRNHLKADVRLTLNLPIGRPVLPDFVRAALAWTHEVNFFAQSCLPTRVRLGLDSSH